MKLVFSVLLFVLSFNVLQAQVIYEPLQSDKLGESREIKIQLPSVITSYSIHYTKLYDNFRHRARDFVFEMQGLAEGRRTVSLGCLWDERALPDAGDLHGR